jgi:3-hydroxyisobutyrate dehydrogenase
MNVGYIGLGALGGSLARRCLAGRALTVWDINPGAVSALVEAGASAAPTAAALARECDVILTCLPRSADVRRLVSGPEGLGEGLSPGKLVIDQTSGIPAETRAIAETVAEKGAAMMDAAVSASPQLALQGGATLMASGPDQVFEQALPVLQGIARTVYRCGSRVGDGQAMKTVNNAINAANRLGTLEIVAMGRKLGLSLQELSDFLNAGPGANQVTERMLPALIEGRESTNFALSLMLKDLDQAVSLGLELGVPTPVVSTVRSLCQIGVNTLGDSARLEQVVGLVESMAGTRIPGVGEAPSERAGPVGEVVVAAVAAMGEVVAYECASVGLRYGLKLGDMAEVLDGSSGWSAASRRLLPALAAGRLETSRPIDAVVRDLRSAARLGMEAGAPTMILNAVRAVVESAANAQDGEADLARFCERVSGVTFASTQSPTESGS